MSDPDPPTVLLPTAEAAARLGLTPAGVRSRVRRGLLRAEHGRSGQLLVEVTTALSEDAGRSRRRRLVGQRPTMPAARSGSTPMPLLVPLAAVLIGGIVLAYLSNRRQKK